MQQQHNQPRNQFVGVKFTAIEWCDLQRAARRASSVSEFIRSAVAKAIAAQQTGASQ